MPQSVQTRTYSRHASVVFRITKERFGGLSNMASGFPLEVNGVRIWSSEALYQACRFPHLPDVQKLIISERSPMTAKMRSKPHRKDSRPDWEKINVTVMKWCLRVKLAQNWTTFGDLLLSTGEAPIVEESTRDKFWAAEPLDDGTLVGGNVLGRLLMELREEFRGSNKQLLTRVGAPNIANFLFLGTPIGTIEADGNAEAKDSVGDATSVKDLGTFSRSPVDQGESQPQIEQPTSEDSPKEVKSTWNQIPRECKRLAEVDFPVAEVSRHSARDNSIRDGHPRSLHLWWARRPLAACRAMLMALLLPDPSDKHCPEEFKEQSRRLLAPVPMIPLGPDDEGLRKGLLKFIADFANWDNSINKTYLECARGLVKAAYGIEPPLVVDPFAGGGSILLEALRVGCDAFASDLNPVACLILKTLLEDIPRQGPELADELRRVGREIKESTEKQLAEFYPLDPSGSRPIAYLWSRTVRCESPKCGAEIPLVRSFWLCEKEISKRALRTKVTQPKDGPPRIDLEIFEPKSDRDVQPPTVSNAKATCLACGAVLAPERVRAQLSAQSGGADGVFDEQGQHIGGARLLVVVTIGHDGTSRNYRLANATDYSSVCRAMQELTKLSNRSLPGGLAPIPNEPIILERVSRNSPFRMHLYGCTTFGDLFNARQKLSLALIQGRLRSESLNRTIRAILTLATGKFLRHWNAFAKWHRGSETVAGTFALQAISMAWDYPEMSPFAPYAGGLDDAINDVTKVVDHLGKAGISNPGQAQIADAAASPLPDACAACWFTDPPYYDAIPYADLADVFYVWHKRVLLSHEMMRNPFEPSSALTPKAQEIVQDDNRSAQGRPKDRLFFEESIAGAFGEGHRVLSTDGVGCIVFAHKTTEGWEALLSGIQKGGWVITASWPIATERGARLRARESAALATSVHLVCRPRGHHGVGGWEAILQELPRRIDLWMERLSSEGIRGADLVFSCIGPALELFSKYGKVETAEGREVKLDEFLEKVWEVVGRSALQQVLGTAEARARNGAATALEEDARLTALFLWTLQSIVKPSGNSKTTEELDKEEDKVEATKPKKGYILIHDVVRRFAQPLGIHLEYWDGRIIETKKGIVRLIPVLEREEQLFGTSGTNAVARALERTGGREPQYMLFPEEPDTAGSPKRGKDSRKGRGAKREDGEALAPRREATTLDRVHAAILLQARGEATALRALLQAEIGRTPDFLRLANALSALYPKDSEEKRLLDAMLLGVPR